MKKLLSVLGSFGLVATAGAAVVACGPDEVTFALPDEPEIKTPTSLENYIGPGRKNTNPPKIWIESEFINTEGNVEMSPEWLAHHLFTGFIHQAPGNPDELTDTNENGFEDNYFESQNVGSKLSGDRLIEVINDNKGNTITRDGETVLQLTSKMLSEGNVKIELTEQIIIGMGQSSENDIANRYLDKSTVDFSANQETTDESTVYLEVIFLPATE